MALLAKRKDNPEARMSIGGHLREFRNRASIAALAIVVLSIVAWVYLYTPVYDYLKQPLQDYARDRHISPDLVRINFNGVAQPFNMKLKVSTWIGFVLAAPVWLWQIWAFLVPGLTKREKFVGRAFIAAAVPLFAAGIFMGARIFGSAITLLMSATPGDAANLPTASEYFSFVSHFILAFGFSFLLPVFLMAFNTMRILPARTMLKGWRFAVIIILIFAAVMTPTPDVYTMFLFTFPLIALYFGTVGFATIVERLRARRDDKERPEWMDVSDDKASAL